MLGRHCYESRVMKAHFPAHSEPVAVKCTPYLLGHETSRNSLELMKLMYGETCFSSREMYVGIVNKTCEQVFTKH